MAGSQGQLSIQNARHLPAFLQHQEGACSVELNVLCRSIHIGSAPQRLRLRHAPAISKDTGQGKSLLDHEGSSVLVVLLVPAAIALAGVARPTERVLAVVAAAIGVCCVLGILTVGLFYVPTLVAAALAAARA